MKPFAGWFRFTLRPFRVRTPKTYTKNKKRIKKYHLELDTTNEDAKLKMIWLLQGKTDKELWDIDYYHNSSMAKIYRPKPVCGIFNLNFENPNENQLYNEIKKYF